MTKLYYEVREDGSIGCYSNSKIVAKDMVKQGIWKEYRETDEEIVMQGDNSGFVLKSQYKAYEPTKEEVQEKELKKLDTSYNNCIKELKSYMTEALLMEDTDLQSELKEEYAGLVKDYSDQRESIINN